LDTEFVGVGKNTVHGGSRNALARVSIVTLGGKVLLDSTVRVSEPVADFRIAITGLTQDAVDRGISAEDAKAWVAHILHDRVVVGHSLAADWKVLGYEHPAALVRDTATYRPLRPLGSKQKPSLANLAAEWLNREMQTGVHDSVEDAAAALDLYLLRREEWEASLDGTPAHDAGSPPPPPGAVAPVGAAALVRNLAEEAIAIREEGGSLNAELAELFDCLAVEPEANHFAKSHFRRVASTFASLPFRIKSAEDLDRPELRCIGKEGTKTRTFALAYVREYSESADRDLADAAS